MTTGAHTGPDARDFIRSPRDSMRGGCWPGDTSEPCTPTWATANCQPKPTLEPVVDWAQTRRHVISITSYLTFAQVERSHHLQLTTSQIGLAVVHSWERFTVSRV